MSVLAETLEARAKTHGDYSEHARVTQAIKDAFKSGPSYPRTNAHQRETLDMVAHKMGRIVCGFPHDFDHWHDIAGYATLSAERTAKLAPMDGVVWGDGND